MLPIMFNLTVSKPILQDLLNFFMLQGSDFVAMLC